MNEKINILGFQFTNSTFEELAEKVEENITKRQKYLIHNINPYILLEALKRKSFYQLLISFSDLYLDGIGIFIAAKILYGKNSFKKKITGTDLYPFLFRLADQKKYDVFFWGGSELACSTINSVLLKDYPNVNLVGNFSRNFNDINYIKSQINEFLPDMIFIGLGTPVQENVSKDLFDCCNVKFIICVGSGLDYISGVYKRAPIIFRKIGIEWLVRLIYNPKQYWKRYLIGIPLFIFRIIKFKFSMKKESN
ncbi:MAG: WecB/TagA/CpsF family glycosyltransferase [Ignavibacteriae bacterium]|nr:WecB/TagA/CpsF family glycosyltransferase [Ignavibacteriota bacterium]